MHSSREAMQSRSDSSRAEEARRLMVDIAPSDEEARGDAGFDENEEEAGGDEAFDEAYDEEEVSADWRVELSQLSNSSINEAMLHVVDWGEVAMRYVINLLGAGAVLFFHVILRSNSLVELPIFIFSILVMVVAYEVIASKGPVAKGVFNSTVIALAMVALMLHHPETAQIMAYIKTIPLFLFASDVVCSILVVGALYVCNHHSLYKSDLYCALSGQRVILLNRRFDVVKLLKALKIEETATFDKKAGWFGWLERCFSGEQKRMTPIVLGMISVDDLDAMVPDVTLELNDEKLEDSSYQLVRLSLSPLREEDFSINVMESLVKILKRKHRILDRHVKVWMDAATTKSVKGFDKLSKQGKDIRKYFENKDGGNLLHDEFEMNVIAKRVDRIQGLFDHWATRALYVSFVTVVFSLPARYFYSGMIDMHADQCSSPAESIYLPGGELLCAQTACEEICGNPLSYVGAVNDALYTSHVESLFIFVLLPVFIFNYTVQNVKNVHINFENRYFKGLNRNKRSIQEVTAFKDQFEDMLAVREVFSRFYSRYKAWSSWHDGDPDLSAQRSVVAEHAKDKSYENGAFEFVSQSILSSASAQTVDEIQLPYGIRCDDEDGKQEIQDVWEDLQIKHKLGLPSQRNFAVAFTVGCRSAEAWDQWKKWLQTDYAVQLETIFKKENAQDAGCEVTPEGLPKEHSHLTESVVIGDQAIPKGFSVSHITTTNPEDDTQCTIELCKIGLHKDKDKLFRELNQEIKNLEKVLTDPVGIDELLLLPKGVQKLTLNQRFNPNEDSDFGGRDLEIGVRLVLSEQYYTNMPPKVKEDLLKGTPLADKKVKDFTEFVGAMLTPICQAANVNEIAKEDAENNFYDMTVSYLTVIMGEEDPVVSMIYNGKMLARRVGVLILCGLFVLIVPCFRVFKQGGKFFPEPFSKALPINCLFSGIVLCAFFNQFQSLSERLYFVAKSLADFEQKTIDPSGKAAKAKGHQTGQQQTQQQKKEIKDDVDSLGSAFDLTVNEPRTDSSGAIFKYRPESQWWKDQWKQKQDNIQNWHYCAGYLRIFVSSSRLSAQGILIAAGFILAFLLILSLAAVLEGKNGSDLAASAQDFASSSAKAASKSATESVEKTISDARRLAFSLAQSGIAASTFGGRCNQSFLNLSDATNTLREQLHPFRDAMVSSESRRLVVDEEDVTKMMAMAQTITKTQLLTVAMVLLILYYSIPLLYNIALINGAFDKHGNMLLAQKEIHRLNMAKRFADISKDESGGGEANDEGEGGGDDGGDGGGGGGSGGSDGGEGGRGGEGEGGGDVGGGDGGGGAPAKPKGASSTKDDACKRYEKMLDMAIQAANKNKTRFPLNLFGFVINFGLLATWVGLAFSPLANEVKQMGPGLAMEACHWAEERLAATADKVETAIEKGAGHALHAKVPHVNEIFNVKTAFETAVCKPLKQMLKEKAKAATEAMKAGEAKRRLKASIPLAPMVENWWHAYQGDPYMKTIATLQVLDELNRGTHENGEQNVPEVFARRPQHQMTIERVPHDNDVHSWGKRHKVSDSIMSAVAAEDITTINELAMLSDGEVEHLSQGRRLGDRARFRSLVKAIREATRPTTVEL